MDNVQITSLEQVPAGLTLLLRRITDLENKIGVPTTVSIIPQADELRTRKETAKRLNITLATLNEYTKSGKIVANRIGNRVLYKESDIQNALKKVIISKSK